jgi:hypothetical protein
MTQKANHRLSWTKLKKLITESLGGSTHICMIACVSPAQSEYEKSFTILEWASKAKDIKTKPVINSYSDNTTSFLLKQHILDLQEKILSMKISPNLNTYEDRCLKCNPINR